MIPKTSVNKILSDKNGNPLALYHGTNSDFDFFQIDPEVENLFPGGIFFTVLKHEAINRYTGNGTEAKEGSFPTVLTVNLIIQKLADLRYETWNVDDIDIQSFLENMDFKGMVQALKDADFDGIVYDGEILPIPALGSHYVVFDPAQVIITDKVSIK